VLVKMLFAIRLSHFRITKYARRCDLTTGKFHINVAYKTKTDMTDRAVAVSEAFGLCMDDCREHAVFDNVELKSRVSKMETEHSRLEKENGETATDKKKTGHTFFSRKQS
jgi:hypothetical protein